MYILAIGLGVIVILFTATREATQQDTTQWLVVVAVIAIAILSLAWFVNGGTDTSPDQSNERRRH